MWRRRRLYEALDGISQRLDRLDQDAELMRTVMIVKEPTTVEAANAFDGLRKQVLAAAGERRSHLAQVVAMAVATDRATDIADLRGQVDEWLRQVGVTRVWDLSSGVPAQQLFEDLDGGTLDGAQDLDVLEPAYVEQDTGRLCRTGRARRRRAGVEVARTPEADALSEHVRAGQGETAGQVPTPVPETLLDDPTPASPSATDGGIR
jgi:hypothetical protein